MKHNKKCHLRKSLEWESCICKDLFLANGRRKVDIPCLFCESVRASAQGCVPCKRIVLKRQKAFKMFVRAVRALPVGFVLLEEKIISLRSSSFELGEEVWTDWKTKGEDILFFRSGKVTVTQHPYYKVLESDHPVDGVSECFYHYGDLLRKTPHDA